MRMKERHKRLQEAGGCCYGFALLVFPTLKLTGVIDWSWENVLLLAVFGSIPMAFVLMVFWAVVFDPLTKRILRPVRRDDDKPQDGKEEQAEG